MFFTRCASSISNSSASPTMFYRLGRVCTSRRVRTTTSSQSKRRTRKRLFRATSSRMVDFPDCRGPIKITALPGAILSSTVLSSTRLMYMALNLLKNTISLGYNREIWLYYWVITSQYIPRVARFCASQCCRNSKPPDFGLLGI